MQSLNKVLIIGKVVAVSWHGGVATLTITTNRHLVESTETTTHYVLCRNELADAVEAFNPKGRLAYIEGFLNSNNSIEARRVDFLNNPAKTAAKEA